MQFTGEVDFTIGLKIAIKQYSSICFFSISQIVINTYLYVVTVIFDNKLMFCDKILKLLSNKNQNISKKKLKKYLHLFELRLSTKLELIK